MFPVSLAGSSLRLSVEINPVTCITLEEKARPDHQMMEADLTVCRGDTIQEAQFTPSQPLVVVGGVPPNHSANRLTGSKWTKMPNGDWIDPRVSTANERRVLCGRGQMGDCADGHERSLTSHSST